MLLGLPVASTHTSAHAKAITVLIGALWCSILVCSLSVWMGCCAVDVGCHVAVVAIVGRCGCLAVDGAVMWLCAD